jgi:multicomponent Na+:H+ antiporter subunit G
MNETLATVLVGIFGITGSLLLLASALAMFRVRDALSRINVFSPATGLGMPLIVAAAYVFDLHSAGFSWSSLLMAVVAVLCLIIVSSVASNTLARSTVLSGQPVYRKTNPNRLAHPPAGVVDVDPDVDVDMDVDEG